VASLLVTALAGEGGPGRWDWDDEEPEVAWRAEVGEGFAGVAVAGGRVFAFGNSHEEDVITALEVASGEVRWR